MATVTSEMLTMAMKQAVELGLFPKHVDLDAYERNYGALKQVLATALAADGLGTNELAAWRERFPEYEYRHQDDCVALKMQSNDRVQAVKEYRAKTGASLATARRELGLGIRAGAKQDSIPTTDELMGISWWNELSEAERIDWMTRAGNTGVVADAWAAYKRQKS